MDKLKVSAIVPTYNSECFIKETIESLLNQTAKLDEIIIIDDNSSDNTKQILKEYELKYENIKLVKLNINCGSSMARDIGLREAKNKWVLLMDHDDIAEPNLLEEEWERLTELNKRREGDYILIHSAYSQIDENGSFIPGIHRWKQVRSYEILGYLFVRNRIISNSGVLLNKDIALKKGGYDEDLVYSQDWDLWLRLAQVGGFGYVDEPLVRLRRHNKNTSRRIEGFLEDEVKILRKYDLDFIRESIYRRDLPTQINKIDFVSVLFRLNYWEEAFTKIKEVIASDPNFSSAYFGLGLYFLKKEKWDKAQKAFETTLKLNKKNLAALNNLGCIKLIKSQKQKAKEIFYEILKREPDYIDANFNLNLIRDGEINIEKIKFTWRELRPVLLRYSA